MYEHLFLLYTYWRLFFCAILILLLFVAFLLLLVSDVYLNTAPFCLFVFHLTQHIFFCSATAAECHTNYLVRAHYTYVQKYIPVYIVLRVRTHYSF